MENCDLVITVGTLTKHIDHNDRKHYPDNKTAAGELLKLVKPDDTILFKGSRGMHLEDIVKIINEKLD
jgi:UDP-N-acetylmuramyl pentapeptide synthase